MSGHAVEEAEVDEGAEDVAAAFMVEAVAIVRAVAEEVIELEAEEDTQGAADLLRRVPRAVRRVTLHHSAAQAVDRDRTWRHVRPAVIGQQVETVRKSEIVLKVEIARRLPTVRPAVRGLHSIIVRRSEHALTLVDVPMLRTVQTPAIGPMLEIARTLEIDHRSQIVLRAICLDNLSVPESRTGLVQETCQDSQHGQELQIVLERAICRDRLCVPELRIDRVRRIFPGKPSGRVSPIDQEITICLG